MSENDFSTDEPKGFIASIVRVFLQSRLSIVLILFSFCLGGAAILMTPKEEEPQISVPLADVIVQVPGASAAEVEKLVATPLERLLWQVDGVEYVYATSRPDAAVVTVRFYVGEDREASLVKLYNAIMMHQDLVPSIVKGWLVKPVEIDDVPIVTLTLSSDIYDEYGLRRIGEEMFARLTETEDISKLTLTGGLSREIRVELNPERLYGMGLSPLEVADSLKRADMSVRAGSFDQNNKEYAITADSFLRSAKEVSALVVGVHGGNPVYLRDVAEVMDTSAEPASYTRIGFSKDELIRRGKPGDAQPSSSVTLALAKKKGTNAVSVAENILSRVEAIKAQVLPDGVNIETTRNYGLTAQNKVGDLIDSLVFALVTVAILLMITMGWREALIVSISVPVSFSLALFVNMLLGYTINRVTLFALILSLGLVVDDPIVNVDNIQRHILAGKRRPRLATLVAVREVLPPVIMSTLTIVVSFLPLYFITGMMGPYMAPMAANVPLTVGFSTVAALTVVPWLSYLLLRKKSPLVSGLKAGKAVKDDERAASGRLGRFYRAMITPFLDSRAMRWGLTATVVVLLGLSVMLAAFRLVPLKMLPFDNKNEFQLVINLPEGSTLEATDRTVKDFEAYLRDVPEVTNFTSYVGTASPMDFNAMVRHYYLRGQSNQADIRVNLLDKSKRDMQSHAITLRLRKDLTAIAEKNGATLKIVETPPGPPVIATLVAEVYGAPDTPYGNLIKAAQRVADVMKAEPFVVDVDDTSETPHDRINFHLDKEKAALNGVQAEDVTAIIAMAISGSTPANVHIPGERQALPVKLILPREKRSSLAAMTQLPVKTDSGKTAPMGELGSLERVVEDQPIYHKNMRPVAYVFGEMAGRAPAEAILDMQATLAADPLPHGITVDWAGEGEWKITIDVFRDLGIAFGAALLGIYILLIIETASFSMPLLLMMAIPLTLLGIMPGFWLLNLLFTKEIGGFADPVFFTATSMIGMIALGGIVIRNSLVLINFIQESMKQGMALKEAVVRSGAIRFRPIVLTACTTALGAWPITLDPIFSGLAWALIFGLVASTLFSLVIIPVAYYAVTAGKQ